MSCYKSVFRYHPSDRSSKSLSWLVSVHFVYLESDDFILSYFFLSDSFANWLKALRANLEITLCLMPCDLMNCVCRLWVGFVSSETLIWSFECLLSYSTFTYINPPSNRPSTFNVSANFLLERICLLMLLLLFDVQSNWCLSIDKPVLCKAKSGPSKESLKQ